MAPAEVSTMATETAETESDAEEQGTGRPVGGPTVRNGREGI